MKPHRNIPSDLGECTGAKEMASVFKALGDNNRLCIVYLLARDESGRLGVSDLARLLGISQPAVSQHLKILRAEKIVHAEKNGFHVFFSFNQDRLNEIADLFNRMQALVQTRCDKQILMQRRREEPLNILFLCFSYTGVTRRLITGLQDLCGGDLLEFRTQRRYGSFTAYTAGCIRSRKEEPDPVIPETLDVSGYSLLVIGVPVWAWKPAPAAYSIISGLIGCEGKKAVICTTCSGQPGESIPILRRCMEERGIRVMDTAEFTGTDLSDPWKKNNFVSRILEAYDT